MEPTAICRVCNSRITTTSVVHEHSPKKQQTTMVTSCECHINRYTYKSAMPVGDTAHLANHACAALDVYRQQMADAFLNLPTGWKMATRQDVADAIHKPPAATFRCSDCGKVFGHEPYLWDHMGSDACPSARARSAAAHDQMVNHPHATHGLVARSVMDATTIQRAAEALADGLETLCDPHRVMCARCGMPLGHELGWCGKCLAHFSATRESMQRTIGAGKILPRPGAIVLCVDDPCGDDVAEG